MIFHHFLTFCGSNRLVTYQYNKYQCIDFVLYLLHHKHILLWLLYDYYFFFNPQFQFDLIWKESLWQVLTVKAALQMMCLTPERLHGKLTKRIKHTFFAWYWASFQNTKCDCDCSLTTDVCEHCLEDISAEMTAHDQWQTWALTSNLPWLVFAHALFFSTVNSFNSHKNHICVSIHPHNFFAPSYHISDYICIT